jgi:hypothetical protein
MTIDMVAREKCSTFVSGDYTNMVARAVIVAMVVVVTMAMPPEFNVRPSR